MELGAEEVRVVGCLIEKQLTTPDQYPLTLNALISACNQTSSRNPLVDYDRFTVEAAVGSLKPKGLVRFVHPSHGRSAIRYRQVLDEVVGLETDQLALLAVLMLRGPQTVGALRSRTERMARFAGLEQLEQTLQALADRSEPLVVRMEREPGRKEPRWLHLLAGDAAVPEGGTGDDRPPPPPAAPGLAEEVEALKNEVVELRRDLDRLLKRLGE